MKIFAIEEALNRLNAGEVVAIPTETVYGLAAKIDSKAGIEKIFSTKQRPFFDPLIVHVSSKKMAETLTKDWSPLADFLADHFWPGPLTLVLPKAEHVHGMITSGLESVGIRMPKHTLTLGLIDRVGVPLAAPSANRFGKTSPTTAEHVRQEFPNQDILILDGGACEVGLESTVLSIQRQDSQYQLCLLRAGAIKKSDLENALASKNFNFQFVESAAKGQAPGQMKHHYMPEIPLVLVIGKTNEADILHQSQRQILQLPDQIEGVKIIKPKKFETLRRLELPNEATAAARLLYSELRSVSQTADLDLIYFLIEPHHQAEDWKAVMDRMTKAASLILDSEMGNSR